MFTTGHNFGKWLSAEGAQSDFIFTSNQRDNIWCSNCKSDYKVRLLSRYALVTQTLLIIVASLNYGEPVYSVDKVKIIINQENPSLKIISERVIEVH